ncbi:MAG TPA: energy transducer TonB [Vicinamibacterales bacterium]|nr:energy transducer TonB [Vicinamibacterales bacterium]
MLAHVILAMLIAGPSVAPPALQAGAAGQPPASTGQADKPWPPVGVLEPGPDVKSPRVVREQHPGYTAAAMRARIQGAVRMEAVIEKDGSVGEVRVTQSLDREHGLDDGAVKALRNWRFEPGTKDGAAVPVLVVVEMTFTLRK